MGRGIRHEDDYFLTLLIDSRFYDYNLNRIGIKLLTYAEEESSLFFLNQKKLKVTMFHFYSINS